MLHPSIAVSGHTLQGEYTKDPNKIFKMLCSTLTNQKPDVCKRVNIQHDYDFVTKEKIEESHVNNEYVKVEAAARYKQFD